MPIMNFLLSYDSLVQPQSVAVDRAGNVFVADSSLGQCFHKFDGSGKVIHAWGSQGSGNGQFKLFPSGVAVDSAGGVYVTDPGNCRVQKFDSSGKFILAWGSSGSGNGQFLVPQSIAADSSGNLYVADPGNGRIQKFDASGKFLLAWSSPGQPLGLAIDAAGSVYVTEPKGSRVQKFDGTGRAKLAWGSPGSGNGQFAIEPPGGGFAYTSSPAGVAVDSAGGVYVTDPGNYRVQKFDGSGDFKFAWGSPGSGNGQFNYCNNVAVDSVGNVYVVDTPNNRVQKFFEIETTQPTFQPFQPRSVVVYVLGSDGNLWLETGPFGNQIPPSRLQVDGNVAAFQALDSNNVFVLGSDRNLWLEKWPYGNIAQTIRTRLQVDANAGAFQAIVSPYGNKVFVLGSDGNLWCETWPSGDVSQTIKTRQQIDASVRAFQALDVYDLVVLGADGKLWFEGAPWGNVAQTIKSRKQIDANVRSFQPIDGYHVFVLGTDGNLWLEIWPAPGPTAPYKAWGNLQETLKNRRQVDANVAAFQAIDLNTVFVLGGDGNLWLETSPAEIGLLGIQMLPWGNVAQTIKTRQHVDSGVGAFNAWVDEHNVLGDWIVFVKDTDHVLWYEQSPIAPSTSWTRRKVDLSVM